MGDILFDVAEDRDDNSLPDWILEAARAVAANMCAKIDESMLEDIRGVAGDGQSLRPDEAPNP